jgi:RarD protein
MHMENKTNDRKSLLMFIAAMLIFGTVGIFREYIPFSSAFLAFSRGILGGLFLLVYMKLTGKTAADKLQLKQVLWLAATGAVMGINWILLFEAYNHTTVAVATLCYYMQPTIVILLSPLLFKEKLSVRKALCAAAAIAGMVLVSGVMDGGMQGDSFKGILLGLGAAVFYATVVLLNKFIKNVEGIHRTFLQFLSAVAVLFPYVLLTSGFTLGKLNGIGWANLLIVDVIHTGVTYCMYFSSLKELSGQKAAILSYIDPLVAVVISVTVLSEKMTVWQVIGGALILGFTLWNEISPKKEKGTASK